MRHTLHPVAGRPQSVAAGGGAVGVRVGGRGARGQPIGQLGSLNRYLEQAADEQHFITRSTDLLATLFNRRAHCLMRREICHWRCSTGSRGARRVANLGTGQRSAGSTLVDEAERAMTHPDILIVGAGVAGLSLATALGREGFVSR